MEMIRFDDPLYEDLYIKKTVQIDNKKVKIHVAETQFACVLKENAELLTGGEYPLLNQKERKSWKRGDSIDIVFLYRCLSRGRWGSLFKTEFEVDQNKFLLSARGEIGIVIKDPIVFCRELIKTNWSFDLWREIRWAVDHFLPDIVKEMLKNQTVLPFSAKNEISDKLHTQLESFLFDKYGVSVSQFMANEICIEKE